MSVRWTKDQEKAIHLGNRNILVSAAAGSGKTAVLVERIITMLTRQKNPLDVDRLLVVTFTEAAAAEMKERVRKAVEERIESEPENEHLRRQETLIHSAQITTIHSFCLSVIREHFHTIDLDPSFRIGEEGELKLLGQEVLSEVLEEFYEEGDRDFLNLVEGYGGGRDDRKLEELVLRLHEFSRSYPEPGKWLTDSVRAYDVKSLRELEDTVYYRCIVRNVERYLEGARQSLEQGIQICREPDGPYMYEEMLECDIRAVEEICRQQGYEETRGAFQDAAWMRLAPNRDRNVSEEKAGRVKKIREEVKAVVKELKGLYFAQTGNEVLADLQICRPVMEMLAKLTLRYSEELEKKKRARNLIDFDDMQQYALRILTREEEGELVPSDVAAEYQNQFEEIMIDEYQDSNLIQETILTSVSRIRRGSSNLFMVGDVKQSIYRFRLSRPELFMEKYDRYSPEGGEEQRIDLSQNFRSRREVLDSVNAVFGRIMRRSLGGVEYDGQAALYAGAEFPGAEGSETELLLIDTAGGDEGKLPADPGEDLSAKEKEALAVAWRIKELMACQMVTDPGTKELRPIRYGDIVILVRSLKGYADEFAGVLEEAGIPVYAGMKEGYFETREIGVLLDYLRVLNNRRQDLPLAAALKSCFGRLTDEELALIRGKYRNLRFYQAAEQYRREGPNDGIRRKLEAFLEKLESYRSNLPYLALHELLEKIVRETGYRDYVAALPAGEQREANLSMLIEKARSFESSSYKGLFHFIRYVEQLKKYEIDYGEANTSGEEADTVRLMSIHKSKGLEFPVVIAAGMGKRFNRQDIKGDVLMHAYLGVGLECVNLEERTRCPSLMKSVIAREELLESMGEELRVLYVALTRAKEKLIITGAVPDPEKRLREAQEDPAADGGIPFGKLACAATCLDWLIPAVGRMEEVPLQVKILRDQDLRVEHMKEQAGQMLAEQTLRNWDAKQVYDSEMEALVREQFSYSYPFGNLEGKKLKYTVSELKKRAYLAEEAGEVWYEEEAPVPLIPKFLQESGEITGASRGSAYHRVMELLDFRQDYEEGEIREEIRKMQREGRLGQELAACVRPEDVLGFVNSRAGRRMKRAAKAGVLWKEQPFVLGVPIRELYPQMQEEPEETVLIQGIIDVYFQEPEGLVVLDYKTDRVRTAGELLEKYQAQLEYYARALEQITGRKVREKIIYSFTLQQEISWQ